MAALLGALPIAFGTGIGGEARRPLGIAIVGGLVLSQSLTLYIACYLPLSSSVSTENCPLCTQRAINHAPANSGHGLNAMIESHTRSFSAIAKIRNIKDCLGRFGNALAHLDAKASDLCKPTQIR
jgi:hypothetical protein